MSTDTDPADEIWLPVVGYEGCYEVSNQHRVRTVERVIVRSNGHPQTIAPRIRRHRQRGGYHRQVTLVRDGQYMTFRIHPLVEAAFKSEAAP